VIETVEELDLEPFHVAYRADGHGRAVHEPKMMVGLLAYAYAIGQRSSRGIERRCREDVAFRVITANQVPDHATIARFRVRNQDALADLFGQVLGLYAEAGLVEARAAGRRDEARGLGVKPRAPQLRTDRRGEHCPGGARSTPPRTNVTATPAATSWRSRAWLNCRGEVPPSRRGARSPRSFHEHSPRT
jgi:Transposase domain (DUF772)